MFRRSRVPQSFVLGLAVLVALASAGCSNMPTAPMSPAISDAGSAASAGSATSEPAQVLGLLGGSSTTTSKSTTIGVLGGIVSVGDFTLVVPPLALTRTATITVTQADLTKPVVQLSISPSTANRFLVPVILTANARKMDRTLLSVACISYYNPSTGKWEDLASTVSLLNLTVSTPLSHFSTYRVTSGGKAGW
jgi:hypothetical protein